MTLDMADDLDPELLRYGTPEWDEVRESRRGHPSGSHIRAEPAPEEEVIVDAFAGQDFVDAVEKVLHRYREQEPPMETRARWLPADWGSSNTLTMIAMLIGFCVTIFGAYSYYRDNQDRQNQLNTKIASTLEAMSAAIQANDAGDKERTARYGPQLEAMQRAQDVGNNRLDNMARALADLRDALQETTRTAMADHTDVQVLKMQLQQRGAMPRAN